MNARSKAILIYCISIASIVGVMSVIVALWSTLYWKSNKNTTSECLDTMSIIVVAASNEHYACEDARQKIEVYPGGVNNVLVKCVCQRK